GFEASAWNVSEYGKTCIQYSGAAVALGSTRLTRSTPAARSAASTRAWSAPEMSPSEMKTSDVRQPVGLEAATSSTAGSTSVPPPTSDPTASKVDGVSAPTAVGLASNAA